jgi:hypothetical protein
LRGFTSEAKFYIVRAQASGILSRAGCGKAESIFVNEAFNAYFRQI